MVSKRERASSEEGTDDLRAASEAAQGPAEALFEDLEVGWALAGERMLFHPSPQPLVGIEFGGVGGQPIDAQAGLVLGEGGPSLFRAMGIQTIPKQEEGAWNPMQQVADEADDLRAGDGAPHQTEVGVRAGGDRRDGGQLGPVEAVIKKGRLASWCPGLARGGQQREAALIDKDEYSILVVVIPYLVWFAIGFKRMAFNILR